jgi:hypothetical protein
MSAEPQRLESVEFLPNQNRFPIPPPFDTGVFVYVAGDNRALPYYGPVLVGRLRVVSLVIMYEMNIIVPPVRQVHDPQVDTSYY